MGAAEIIDDVPKRAYGDYISDRFWLEKQKFHVMRTLRRGVLAVTQIKSDLPTPEPTQPIAYDEAHLVGFQVWNSLDHELWLDRRPAKSEPFKLGETAFYDLRRSPGAYMRTPYHSLQFYLPHAALAEIAEQHGTSFHGELRYRYGIPQADHVLQNLGLALMPALGHGGALDGLFLDHILQAVAAHVAGTYGEPSPAYGRAAGGLAPWQERRVKEIMRDGMTADVSLKRLAAACNLSVSHFARAFRCTTRTTPHGWLRERRIEKALALLARGEMALSDIASACGFADQSHFTRVFTKCVGVSPGRWRRENGRAH